MYGIHPIPRRPYFEGRFIAMKAYKRLFIQDIETGELIYSPPDFLTVSRHQMEEMAHTACCKGCLPIRDVVSFEAEWRQAMR